MVPAGLCPRRPRMWVAVESDHRDGPDGYRLVPDSESIAVINSFNRESFARMTAPLP